MTRHLLPERLNQHQKASKNGHAPPLESPRCTDADQLTDEEPEIEAAGVNQQSLENVGVAAEMHAAHAARLEEMGEGPFQSLTAQSQ